MTDWKALAYRLREAVDAKCDMYECEVNHIMPRAGLIQRIAEADRAVEEFDKARASEGHFK